MSIDLEYYRGLAPPGQIDLLRRLADRLRGRTMMHVTAPPAMMESDVESLERLVSLTRDAGLDCRWETLRATEASHAATAALYSALQGGEVQLGDGIAQQYRADNLETAQEIDLRADAVIVHDPPPAGLVEFQPHEGRWIWHCHIDVSRPEQKSWSLLRPYVVKYEAAVFALPGFAPRLPIPRFLIHPAIDPMSERNRDLTAHEKERVLERLGLPADRPMLLQVAPFDDLAAHRDAIEVYRLVRRQHACRLVLAGGGEPGGGDADPAEAVRERAGGDPEVHVLDLPPAMKSDLNALERAAAVVLRLSASPRLDLTAAEAMWKGKPVVARLAGGISAQVVSDMTGYVVSAPDAAAFRTRQLLADPERAAELGRKGHEWVRQNLLITRHLGDYLALVATVLS